MAARSLALAAVLSFGCVSTSIDEAALHSAADARQRQAGLARAQLPRDVNALLARPLTADAAVQVALLNNRGLRASLEQLAIARAGLSGVRRLPNPTLEGALRFGGEGDPEVEVGAMIDVTELLLVLSRGGATAAGVEAARLDAVAAILDLAFETRAAFVELQAALQQLELRGTVQQAFGASADLAGRLREAGNITELERATQQSVALEARLSYQRAERNVAAARERLNGLMGLWGRGTGWAAVPRLPEPAGNELPIETLEAEAVRRSLDLEIAKQRFTAAAKRSNVATAAGWLPELRAGVSAERDEAWAVGPAVELELPLFYQGQGEVALARAAMRQQQNVYTDTAVRLRARAREAATRLRAAREAVGYFREVLLPLKQKVLDETQLQYNAMAAGAFQLLAAKRDQIESASAYIDQLREYWLARTEAEQLLAGRFGARLADPDATTAVRAPGAAEQAH
jgi:cobalt-zinc-cadmium efflux system outer membrane protein